MTPFHRSGGESHEMIQTWLEPHVICMYTTTTRSMYNFCMKNKTKLWTFPFRLLWWEVGGVCLEIMTNTHSLCAWCCDSLKSTNEFYPGQNHNQESCCGHVTISRPIYFFLPSLFSVLFPRQWLLSGKKESSKITFLCFPSVASHMKEAFLLTTLAKHFCLSTFVSTHPPHLYHVVSN